MAKVIMIQGTASGVGKSVLSAALCRVFAQDGYITAPFKAQNMSRVCHGLADGSRMARSQVLAAYACARGTAGFTEPNTDMNPILLIPSGKTGSEVIINGKSRGHMSPAEYAKLKPYAFEQALEAYGRLAAAHDVIVVEGAGSPVELNLNQNDIVNMGLAERIGAPVILVSDIARGGVFAALYGTVALLTEARRALVKGLVVNKFKGDVKYFGDGRDILERLCGVPVLGVVPHTEVKLEDEDSLTDFGSELKTRESAGVGSEVYAEFLNAEFDRLASHVRRSLDLERVYEIMG